MGMVVDVLWVHSVVIYLSKYELNIVKYYLTANNWSAALGSS